MAKGLDFMAGSIKRSVLRSDGVAFRCLKEAAKATSRDCGMVCQSGNISRAARGLAKSAYGYTWKMTPHKDGLPVMGKRGDWSMVFNNTDAANEYLRRHVKGFVNPTMVSKCCAGLAGDAYGIKFTYIA